MKISLDRNLRYTEVSPELRIKPVSLFGLFQEAAEHHTDQVGLRTQDLLEQGFAWMMYKMAVRIASWPRLGQSLELWTWSTGIKGYRAMREFEILADGETAVQASSVWFAVDLQAGRIQRIPEDMASIYEVEPAASAHFNLKPWKPEAFPNQASRTEVGIRPSDLDPYGHVNNAVYLDYLETALNGQGLTLDRAGEMRILFRQGITLGTERVRVETADSSGGMLFRIASAEEVFAEGGLIF